MEINNEKGALFGYCPKHLVVEGREELWVFPLNILFTKFRSESDGSQTMGSAVYNPDFSSFIQDKEKWSMTYRNQYGGDNYVIITFNVIALSYRGDKFVNGVWVGSGNGVIKINTAEKAEKGWELFFFHLTIPGLINGERCLFEKINEPQRA